MRALRGIIVLILALALPAPVLAADYQTGLEAYNRGDYATALKEWRPLAEQGDGVAQFNLGTMYNEGRGVAQDYIEAVKWYRLAAEQGDASAQYNLGALYYQGQGVPTDYTEAVKWFRLAAEQDHANAQLNLGAMYGNGKGVRRDNVQSHMWLNLAASRLPSGEDRDMAVSNRDIAEGRMTPAQVAEAERLAREWKPK